MKNLVLAATILLAAPLLAAAAPAPKPAAPAAKPAAPVHFDLNGEWQAEFHDPGSVDVEKIMIVDYGDGLTATKETGDVYVPAGQVTFKGTYNAASFTAQQQGAMKGHINPVWKPVTITVLDKDHFTLKDPYGNTDHWSRLGKPTLALDDAILFDLDKYQLKPAAGDAIAKVVAFLGQMHPNSHLLIAGYTDDTGSDALNLPLSQKRAETVAAALTAKGIAAARLQTKGFGKSNPRYPNTNDDARAHNRRVEIVVQD
jgi:outer membrane protein OmpA-like peptidoglycan-associated protein